METNWARIWQDFKITFWFLSVTIVVGLAFTLIQSVGIRTTAFFWALATLASGALIGFLFGIPRVLQETNAPQLSEPAKADSNQTLTKPVYRMQVNTNLEQISDWLTKIIVGFGLIQLRLLPDYLNRLSLFIASGLGSGAQAQVLSIAIILYFFVVGFLGGYLMTRIYLAQAFSRADWGAQNTVVVAGAELTIAELSEQSRSFLADLQDQILNLQKQTPSLRTSPEEGEQPTTTSPVRSILWVDDNPKNNSFLIERLEKLGIRVTAVLSTTEALETLKTKTFDRIVSDMGRLESSSYNSSAGLDLIKAVRNAGIDAPIAFYCSLRAVATYAQEAKDLGAKIITASPTELLQALQIEV